MDQAAIKHAQERLRRVRNAIAAMEQAKIIGNMDVAWWTFVLAANSIYTKLELGAKGSGPAGGWLGKKLRERRKDELLSYIHQARNFDEHNLQGAIQYVHQPRVSFVDGEGYTIIRQAKGSGQELRITRKDPHAKIQLRVKLPGAHLKPVKDRFGHVYNPPETHLGKPLTDKRPIAVAKLALSYLEQLVSEASDYVTAHPKHAGQ